MMSSPHSYVVLVYAGSEKATKDVGFYYAANAAGRLVGIVLPGFPSKSWWLSKLFPDLFNTLARAAPEPRS